jgi:hypothetical protein
MVLHRVPVHTTALYYYHHYSANYPSDSPWVPAYAYRYTALLHHG